MKKRLFFLSLLFLAGLETAGAQADSLLKDRYYRHNYDNDFFTATDRYYTQGVYLELIFPVFKKTLLAKTLIPLRPQCRGRIGTKVVNYYGMSLERQGYTPASIQHPGPFPGDRPYCAILYLVHSLVSQDETRHLRLTTRICTGAMGPNLRGKEEQETIHTALGNLLPHGWEKQIENDYILNYDLFIEKGIVNAKHFELTGLGEFRAGTLYDDASLGSRLRIGWMQPYFSNLGLTRQKDARKLQFYLFAKGKVKAVAYNASMQGGVINHNSTYTVPAKDMTRLVGSVSCGVVLGYKKLALEYSLAGITPEFREGKNHAWGRVGIYVCF